MKKLILIFALLFSVSSAFISCRETEREADDMEINEEMDEMGDELEEAGDEMEEEVDEMDDDM
jgi:hypothetical protein